MVLLGSTLSEGGNKESLYGETNQIKKKIHTPNYYGFYVNKEFVSPESIDAKYLLKEDFFDCSIWKYSWRIFFIQRNFSWDQAILLNLIKIIQKLFLINCYYFTKLSIFQKTD